MTVELSIVERIWGLIHEIVSTIAELFSTDFEDLIANIITHNNQLNAMPDVVQQLRTAE